MKERNENFYETIVKGSPIGYAYHKIILNESGEPCDYEFIEVNSTFENMTGLIAANIIGKRITEVMPTIKEGNYNWIGVYGEVALTGKTIEFDQFSEPLNRWFRVKAESPQKYYFITRFLDISKETRQATELEEFFKVNLDLVCVANTDGFFLQVNREWENVTGYTIEEMAGSRYLEYVHPDDWAATRETMTTLAQQKPLLDFVNRFRCKDGTYRHIEWRAQAKGKQIYAAARDITAKVEENRCLELLISMSEEFLQFSSKQEDYNKIAEAMRILSGAKYAVLNLYDKGGDTYHTVAVAGMQDEVRKAVKMVGIDLVGKIWPYDPIKESKIQNGILTVFPHLGDLSGKVIPEAAIKALCKLFSLGEVVLAKIVKDKAVLGELTMLMPAGKRFERENLVNIYTRQVGLLLSRLQSEERINKLLDENEKIFNGTQGALFLLQVLENNQFRYLKSNDAFYERTGIRLNGKMPCDIYDKEEAKRYSANYMKCILAKAPISYEETRRIRGEERIWAMTLTPVFDNGKPLYIVGYSEDITQKKKAENELKENLQLSEELNSLLTQSHASVKSLLDDALGVALRFTASAVGYISLYDEDRRLFQFHTWTNQPKDMCCMQDDHMPMHCGQTGLWGDVTRSGKPQIINNFSNYQYLNKMNASGHISLQRCAAVPIFDRNKLVAVIGVANKKEDYNESDILRLTLLMNNVWSVVERTNSEQSLKSEKELLKTTLFSIGDGILATDSGGRVILLNEAAQQFTGWTQEEAYGKDFEDVFQLLEDASAEKEMQDFDRIGTANYILVSQDGTRRPIAKSTAPIMGDDGTSRGVVIAFRDITLEKQHQEEIEFLSYHDQLTGLYNRHFFEEELRRMNTKGNLPLTIVMADVNGLKLTNDAFGHAAGDRLLACAADMFRSVCREDDIVARLGGDEFVILMPRTPATKAEQIVSELKSLCEGESIGSVELSLSFGCHTKETANDDIALTLKKAEDNMYRSKLFESPSMRGKTIQAIVQTLYETHPREQKHSERVSHFSETMGHALGLSEKELGELKTTALLHDIGKIAIESSILNKAETLTDLERAEIKRHSEIGYRILSSVNDLADIAEYVLAHHERWDGKGYPKGLAGLEIPLWSRIISIADSFDAMTAERAYRLPVSEEEAILELRRNAGIQYDAALLRTFVEKVLHRDW